MKRLHVLVVEDEALVAMHLEDLLVELGHQVRTSGTLQEGLEIASNNTFDAAILDVNLDGKPSYPIADLCQRLGLPFAFVTGYGATGVSIQYSRTLTLAKPFAKPDLEDVLTKLIRES